MTSIGPDWVASLQSGGAAAKARDSITAKRPPCNRQNTPFGSRPKLPGPSDVTSGARFTPPSISNPTGARSL